MKTMTRCEIVSRVVRCLQIENATTHVFSIFIAPVAWGTEIKVVNSSAGEFFDTIAKDDQTCGWRSEWDWHLAWEGTVYDFARQLPSFEERSWTLYGLPTRVLLSAEVIAQRLRPRYTRKGVVRGIRVQPIYNTNIVME